MGCQKMFEKFRSAQPFHVVSPPLHIQRLSQELCTFSGLIRKHQSIPNSALEKYFSTRRSGPSRRTNLSDPISSGSESPRRHSGDSSGKKIRRTSSSLPRAFRGLTILTGPRSAGGLSEEFPGTSGTSHCRGAREVRRMNECARTQRVLAPGRSRERLSPSLGKVPDASSTVRLRTPSGNSDTAESGRSVTTGPRERGTN